MAAIHISEADAARDFARLMAHVRAGDEVIIENGSTPVAVLRNPPSAVPTRTLSETIARMKESSERLGYTPCDGRRLRGGHEGDCCQSQASRIGMGLILDTSILIASERSGGTPDDILRRAQALLGETAIAISAVTVVELTHGIYRARSEFDRARRRIFAEKAFTDMIVQPVTLEIARLAGRIEGEQAAVGNVIAFQDLVIGATALHLGFEVATLNVRHFERIPGLPIVSF